MKKFKISDGSGNDVASGEYLSIQIVPKIRLQDNVIHQHNDMILIYMDDEGYIWEEIIYPGYQIEFL